LVFARAATGPRATDGRATISTQRQGIQFIVARNIQQHLAKIRCVPLAEDFLSWTAGGVGGTLLSD